MSDIEKLRLVGCGLILFVLSLLFSFSELGYAVSGKSTEAQLVEVREIETSGRRGRSRTMLEVKYKFEDTDGQLRREQVRVNTDFEPKITTSEAGVTLVAVQFKPGEANASRLAGQDKMIWVYIFIGSTLLLVGAVVKFVVDYYKDA